MSCPTLEDEDAAVITHYTCDLGDDGVKSYDSVSCDTPPWSSDAVVRHPCLWYVHCDDVMPFKTDRYIQHLSRRIMFNLCVLNI